MLALIEAFLQIMTRRRGPEDLPDSTFLLGLTLAAYVLAQVPIAGIVYGWSFAAVKAIVADIALLCCCLWLLLRFTSRLGRFRRTLTALAGTGALLSVPQVPLVLLSKIAADVGEPAVGATVALLALLFWSILIQAHITSRALSVNLGAGVAIALAYFFLSYQVSAQFAPLAG